mmetsp:Transcript_45032/g.71939  ORF Transcript_45032/g.71939 Transcript_45032/m.71939 type:complete len:220 (-) Transcript_45032:1215-1874(-)
MTIHDGSAVFEMISELQQHDSQFGKDTRNDSPSNKDDHVSFGDMEAGSFGGDEEARRKRRQAIKSIKLVKKQRERKRTLHRIIGVISGLQFAVVILISQRRIPVSSGTEFFVVLAMLMCNASNARILELIPTGDDIKSRKESLEFLLLSVPVFLFLVTIEIWFMTFLFVWTPKDIGFEREDNSITVLMMGRLLSVLKGVCVICSQLLSYCFGRCNNTVA